MVTLRCVVFRGCIIPKGIILHNTVAGLSTQPRSLPHGMSKTTVELQKRVEQQLPASRATPNWSQTQGFVVDLEYKECWSDEDLTWSTKIPFPRLLLSVRGTSKQRPGWTILLTYCLDITLQRWLYLRSTTLLWNAVGGASSPINSRRYT